MWLWFFCASFVVNIMLALYVRWLLKVLAAINEDMTNLNSMVLEFKNHIQSIYEMEMFYGDNTLKALIDHATNLSERIENLDLVLNVQSPEELIEEKQDETTKAS